jgi:hypothetical protein
LLFSCLQIKFRSRSDTIFCLHPLQFPAITEARRAGRALGPPTVFPSQNHRIREMLQVHEQAGTYAVPYP